MVFSSPALWLFFFLFIFGAAIFDLFLLGKRKKALSLKESSFWTLAWIFLALLFNLLIYFSLGSQLALEYLTAYLLEKTLSLDNLFVFLIIFSYFNLPSLAQQKVLKWGILGAFLMRAIFIFGGIWLVQTFDFLFYIFGIFLIFSALRLFFQKEKKVRPEKNKLLKLIQKFIKLTKETKENKFFVKKLKRGLLITPLVPALILIENSDLIFALDSVPAVLSITQLPFIAYTSNAFAILGLRALYFVLANILTKFIYLRKGVIVLLIFIGLKLILHHLYPIPTIFSLGFILIVFFISIFLSLIKIRKE